MGRGRKPLNDEFTAFGRWLVENRKASPGTVPTLVKKARSIRRRLNKPLEEADEVEVWALFLHLKGKARGQYLRAFRLYREYVEARGVA